MTTLCTRRKFGC